MMQIYNKIGAVDNCNVEPSELLSFQETIAEDLLRLFLYNAIFFRIFSISPLDV